MRVLTNGQTRRPASEWREILDRFRGSGVSARQFCERESLVLATFHRWRERLAKTDGPVSSFVEVATPPEDPPAFWSLEVELPDGRVLRMRG